jgi:hypothetical protein
VESAGVFRRWQQNFVGALDGGSMQDVCAQAVAFAMSYFDVDYAAAMITDAQGEETFACSGVEPEEVRHMRTISIGGGDFRVAGIPFSSYLNLPLYANADADGALLLVRSIERGRFSERDRWLAGALVNLVSGVLSVLKDANDRFQVAESIDLLRTESLEVVSLVTDRSASVDRLFRAALTEARKISNANLCHVYRRAPSRLLIASDWWSSDGGGYSTFLSATERMSFTPGEGLPGRVLQRQHSKWIAQVKEDPKFPRRQFATTDGIVSACGVPIAVDDTVVAVLECFFREEMELDLAVDEALSALCAEIGAAL